MTRMLLEDRVRRLVDSIDRYSASVSPAYDEVLLEVAARAASSGSLGKADLGALTAWKRLRADTPWMSRLMSMKDADVRGATARAVEQARNERLAVHEAGSAARSVLSELPGFRHGDALASAVCVAAAPSRMAIYDRRAHRGLRLVDLELDDRPGRYGRFLRLVEQCREELALQGYVWTAREVDLALYALGAE